MERDKEFQAIKNSLSDNFLKESEKHKTKTAEEFQKRREEIMKQQEKEIKAMEEQFQKEYHEKLEKARYAFLEEVEEGNPGIVKALWGGAKLVLPNVFTSQF